MIEGSQQQQHQGQEQQHQQRQHQQESQCTQGPPTQTPASQPTAPRNAFAVLAQAQRVLQQVHVAFLERQLDGSFRVHWWLKGSQGTPQGLAESACWSGSTTLSLGRGAGRGGQQAQVLLQTNVPPCDGVQVAWDNPALASNGAPVSGSAGLASSGVHVSSGGGTGPSGGGAGPIRGGVHVSGGGGGSGTPPPEAAQVGGGGSGAFAAAGVAAAAAAAGPGAAEEAKGAAGAPRAGVVSILKSALQKNVRLCRPEAAVR